MLTKYKFEDIHNNMYLWLNMLYLILKMQSNKGTLILSNIVFANKPYLDFIYILNNYYDKLHKQLCFIKVVNEITFGGNLPIYLEVGR